jgi:putative transcription antitermination factor YqgF
MNLLAVDFGEKKIGLALATGPLSEPIGIVSHLKEVVRFCQEHQVDKIIVGLSEGKMAKKQKRISQELAKLTGLPVTLQDETLTTKEAIMKMKQAGKRVKKKEEDAFAAALILQNYLDKIKG